MFIRMFKNPMDTPIPEDLGPLVGETSFLG